MSMPHIVSSDSMISPNTPTRSWLAGLSASINVGMTNGITEMCVMSLRTTTSQKRLVDHFGMSTAVAPTPSTENIDQLCALTWNSGR